ncbi:MAG: sialate O-acetylesterase [Planctomycetia bacterium]|nr:sialate O-acetylesterase [Planctomycetia bacterium]
MTGRRMLVFHRVATFMLVALAALPAAVQGEVVVSPLFSDCVMLQRGQPIRVWGRAEPGEDVRVSLGEANGSVAADAGGEWIIELPARDAGENLELVVEGRNRIVVKDVILGDIWLCAGQSNMAWPLHACAAKDDIKVADFPRIRRIKIANEASTGPRDEPPVKTPWQRCHPDTVGAFTGVGFYFAREVQGKTGVPIGLLDNNWNGTRIERWIAGEGVRGVPELAKEYAARKGGWSDIHHAMIHPLQRFPIKGVLWYQGESNGNEGDSYFHKLRALIGGWRQQWGRDDLPFYIVQLSNGGAPNEDPAGGAGCMRLREAQARALTIPRTGLAVAIDTVPLKEAQANLHSTNKLDVGVRLAQWALHHDYGMAGLEPSGPLFQSMQVEGERIRLSFAHVGPGLMLGRKLGREPVIEDKAGPLRRFAIAGADKKWVWAEATIDADTVVVSSPDVPAPVAVRYAYSSNPDGANLYNRAGLPAAPFRTDSW